MLVLLKDAGSTKLCFVIKMSNKTKDWKTRPKGSLCAKVYNAIDVEHMSARVGYSIAWEPYLCYISILAYKCLLGLVLLF